jgi:hypothetical protein
MTFHKGLHTHRTLEIVQVQPTAGARFCGLLQSPLTDSNRRPPSLPWRFPTVTRVRAWSLAAHILLQIAPFEGPVMRR